MKTKEDIWNNFHKEWRKSPMILKESFIYQAMEEYGKLMYNQAIDDAIKYGQVRCKTNEMSVTASVYGTVAGESFTVDEVTLTKLKKQC